MFCVLGFKFPLLPNASASPDWNCFQSNTCKHTPRPWPHGTLNSLSIMNVAIITEMVTIQGFTADALNRPRLPIGSDLVDPSAI